jgi:hypothetical protein
VEGAIPEIPGEGEDVGFAAERELVVFFAFAGEFESETEAAFDAAARVDAFLDGDFVGAALEDETAGAGVDAFVVFADDDEIDVFGGLIF